MKNKLPEVIKEAVEFYAQRRARMLQKGKTETAAQLQGRIEVLCEALHHLDIIDYSEYCEIKDRYGLPMWRETHAGEVE
jgi:hypothetical protein